MADTITSKEYNGTGSQNTFTYTFQSYQKEDVKVEIDGHEQTQGTHYQVDSYTAAGGTINFQVGGAAATYYNGSSTVTASPPSGTKNIRVYRDTDISTGSVGVHEPKATYVAGSSIKSADLNNNAKQALYATFELKDQEVQTTDIADGAITSAKILDGTIAGVDIANDAIDSQHYAADSIDAEHYAPNSVDTTALGPDAVTGAQLADNSVDSEHYVDLSIDEAHIAAGAISLNKMANNSVASGNIVNDTIVNDDINTGAAIEFTKLENLDSAKILVGNGSNKATEVAVSGDVTISNTGAVTIAAGAVENGMMANNSVASGNIVNDTIQNTDINTGAAIEFTKLENLDSAKILVGNASNKATEVAMSGDATIDNAGAVTIATGAVEHAMLANDAVDGDNIQDDAIASEHIADAAVQNDHIAAATISGGKIATGAISATQLGANSVTVAKIDNAQLTTLSGMQSGTASVLADSTALTSTTAELNLLDGKSIVTTISSPTDVQIPTAQAVDERIVDLVTDVGGFRPIANETSFPTTNPDPEDNAGTIVSVKALASNLTSNGSGVATIANGAGSGNTVTINGMANSDTIEAGKGILVETTSTLHTYTFHRETLAPADITSAQTAVNDFNARYRILASGTNINTVGSLDDGDLLWDSNVDKMKVYDATASAWKEVTSTGEFKYLYLCPTNGTGAPTYGGASYDLREASNSGSVASVTNAAQLLVSINGVIQKANTGTSAPSEGFAMVDGNSIIFGANIASTDSVFIVQIGSAISIPTPGDDTVSTIKIQNLAVNSDKLASNAVSTAKIADQAVDLTKLPHGDGTSDGKFLRSNNGADPTWVAIATDVAGDSTPQLGGDLDVNGNDIVSTSNANIDIVPNGTGDVTLQADTVQVGDSNADVAITTNGTGDLTLSTNSGTNSGTIEIEDGANNDIVITPNGTGDVVLDGLKYPQADGSADQVLKTDGSAQLSWTTISSGVTSDGQENTIAGTNAGDSFSGTNANNNSLYGYDAGTALTTGDDNTFIGHSSGEAINIGGKNTCVGFETLKVSTDLSSCTIIGYKAGVALAGGSNCVYIGAECAATHTGGVENTAVGVLSGSGSAANAGTGRSNASFGWKAGEKLEGGSYNTLLGCASGKAITTGGSNTIIGYYAGRLIDSGEFNVCVGPSSGYDITSGDENVCVGRASGNNVTGSENTLIGDKAGYDLTSGDNNVCLGHEAGKGQITSDSDLLYIARGPHGSGNAACWIHGASNGDVSNGTNSSSWTTYSDQRLKKNITDNTDGLSIIDNVKVRNFKYKQYNETPEVLYTSSDTIPSGKVVGDVKTAKSWSPVASEDTVNLSDFTNTTNHGQVLVGQGDTTTHVGIIAQELEAVCADCIKVDNHGVKKVNTDELFWHMIVAIKELSAKVKALEAG